MLSVTPAARDYLLSELQRKQAAPEVAIRFTRRAKGWRLRLGQEQPGDAAIVHDGRQLLLLDASAAKALAALTLDFGAGDDARLKLRREPA